MQSLHEAQRSVNLGERGLIHPARVNCICSVVRCATSEQLEAVLQSKTAACSARSMAYNVQVYAKLKNPVTFISYQKGRDFSIWVRALERARTAYTLLGDVALILIGKGKARD